MKGNRILKYFLSIMGILLFAFVLVAFDNKCQEKEAQEKKDIELPLVNLYRMQGQYAQAEPLYKRSLAIREKALGPDHPDVATSLENMAALYMKTERVEEAEKLEKRAAAIRAIKR